MKGAGLVSTIVLVGLALPARGADPRNPDWPCQQVKVPEISLAAVWAGPPLGDAPRRWESDPQVKDLVARLAARRTPLEQAQKMAADFLSTSDAKQDKAKLVFAGLFDTLNRVRSEVIEGIERYTRRQREVAERIRAETLKLRELQDAADAQQNKVDELAEKVQWDTRAFEERRRTIGYVCEVPTNIDRRLFALGRTIQEALE
jgi:hypothetical protein